MNTVTDVIEAETKNIKTALDMAQHYMKRGELDNAAKWFEIASDCANMAHAANVAGGAA